MAVITRPKSCGRALMATSANSSIASEVGRNIAKELKYMNKTECLSSFTNSSVNSMTNCSWENLLEEIHQCCPTLSKVFSTITKHKKHSNPTVCLIFAMLLKLFNQKANLVQSMLSVILYSGGCSMKVRKQVHCFKYGIYVSLNCMHKVIDSLQPLRLTVSHQTLLRLREGFTANFDKEVMEWKKESDTALEKQITEVNKTLICM